MPTRVLVLVVSFFPFISFFSFLLGYILNMTHKYSGVEWIRVIYCKKLIVIQYDLAPTICDLARTYRLIYLYMVHYGTHISRSIAGAKKINKKRSSMPLGYLCNYYYYYHWNGSVLVVTGLTVDMALGIMN